MLREDVLGAFLEVRLNSRDDVGIDGASLVGALEWPTNAQFDRALTFEPLGDGRYVARLGALTHGRWRLRARAESSTGALDFEAELTWPSR